MSQELYGGKGWAKLWSKLEQQGNVGIDYCINPILYPKICIALNTIENVTMVDFGAGTNILAIQFLFGYRENIPALMKCKNLDKARQNVKEFISFEQSSNLVNEAKKYHRDLGYPNSIDIKKMNLVKGEKLPLSNASVDISISRNFVMHLSPEDLEYHLQETARILNKGKYILAVLNPEYEQRKYKALNPGKPNLKDGQRYGFTHGAKGESGVFYHYFKTTQHYEKLFGKHFVIIDKKPCTPIVNEFKNTHERYYWKGCPMAFVYELKKK